MRHLLIFCLLVAAVPGCRQLQLRNNTTRQARTISDMHTQQVLDNLAMFVYAPGSFPSFSTFKQGTSQITDRASLAPPLGFGRFTPASVFGLTTLGINTSLGRDANEAWTIEPVNSPRKLELMRCAYQQAVAGLQPAGGSCPDCEKRFRSFYTGSVDKDVKHVKSGIVTSECLARDGCWFHVGCKHCVPDPCECLYVGHYCGQYVWVTREGRDELAKLTLAILDYAVNEPVKLVTPTKQVVIKRDKASNIESVQITADIGVEDSVDQLLKLTDFSPEAQAKAELRELLSRLGITVEELRTRGPLGVGQIEVLTPEGTTVIEDRLSNNQKLRIIELLAAAGVDRAEKVVTNAQANPQGLASALEVPRAAILQLNNELKAGLRGVDLSPPEPLAPIVIPSQPTPEEPPGILELRQQLNTVTPEVP